MASKFDVGTIEEDFKRIGLIPEAVVEAVETAAETIAEETVETPEKKEEPAEVAEAEQTEGIKLLRKKRPTGKLRMQRRKQKMMRRRNRGKLKLKARKFRRSARGKRFQGNYYEHFH